MTTRPALRFLTAAWLAGCVWSAASSPDAGVTPDAPDAAAPAPDGPFLAADGLPAGQGAMTVSWNLVYVGSNAPVGCTAAGTPTVVLTVTSSGGAPIPTSASCDSKMLTTPPLVAGRYDVRIELKDAAGVVVSSNQGIFDAQPASLTDLGVVTFEIQSFQLSWSLSRGRQALACADVGATTVELTARLAGAETKYSFPCAAGQGATPAILVGSYQIGIRLLGVGGAVLWEAATPMNVNVSPNDRAVLPPVVFTL
jgi:hypothetical protein